MKKRRFYSDKKRGKKWTEPVRGRKIDFADKYIESGTGSDKFDNKRPTVRKKLFTPDRLRRFAKNLIIAVCSFAIICVGYTVMDIYMDLNSMPEISVKPEAQLSYRELQLQLKGKQVESMSLDAGVMLDAVIDEAQSEGYASIVFDAKRPDGTIGYNSTLATVGAYGAISSNSSDDIESSVKKCEENDILPVARVSLYKDNIAPYIDLNMAVQKGKTQYKDGWGNTYLNPNSDSAYEYIKSIIEELKSKGVRIFLLEDYKLPDEISDDYYDGFDSVSKLLYIEFNDDIKLLQAVDIEIESKSSDKIKKELEQSIGDKTESDRVYYISTSEPEKVKTALEKMGVSNYVINS